MAVSRTGKRGPGSSRQGPAAELALAAVQRGHLGEPLGAAAALVCCCFCVVGRAYRAVVVLMREGGGLCDWRQRQGRNNRAAATKQEHQHQHQQQLAALTCDPRHCVLRRLLPPVHERRTHGPLGERRRRARLLGRRLERRQALARVARAQRAGGRRETRGVGARRGELRAARLEPRADGRLELALVAQAPRAVCLYFVGFDGGWFVRFDAMVPSI